MPGVIGKAVPSLGGEASLKLFLFPFTPKDYLSHAVIAFCFSF